jgi:hypothetical protein
MQILCGKETRKRMHAEKTLAKQQMADFQTELIEIYLLGIIREN